MTTLYPLWVHDALTRRLAARLGAAIGEAHLHRFPDRETLVRLSPPGRNVILLAGLDDPDAKLLPLLFAASTARELGAERVGLVAPYLPYMRQDRRFHPGESVSSRPFAALISIHFDWLATVDPHLHRIPTLDALYTVPCIAVPAAPALARWIAAHIEQPLLIGPDEESRQWVDKVAAMVAAPAVVLRKERLGDHEVRVRVPDVHQWQSRTPVLVDDIVSTGGTLIAAAEQLIAAGFPPPACVAVHGLFAGEAITQLQRAGIREIATTETIPGPYARITLDAELATGITAIAGGSRS